MMLRQEAPKSHAQQRASEDARENDTAGCYRTHGFLHPRGLEIHQYKVPRPVLAVANRLERILENNSS